MINYSIIIPHYNIPDLLMRCLKSIPVREDVQVIVVDDCSPGAEMYKNLYPELSRPYLELYSTPIGGSAGRARNVGLEHAKGKWILFADADDYFNPCIGEVLYDYVNSDKDIIFFYSDAKDLYTGAPAIRNLYLIRILDEYNADSVDYSIRFMHSVPWGKIIRHSLIALNNIKFQDIACSNDVLFSVQVGYYARNLAVDSRILYTVTHRHGSLRYLNDSHNMEIRLYARLSKYNFLKENGIKYSMPVAKFCKDFSPQLRYHNNLRHVALENGISSWDFEWQFLFFGGYVFLRRIINVLHLKPFAKRISEKIQIEK